MTYIVHRTKVSKANHLNEVVFIDTIVSSLRYLQVVHVFTFGLNKCKTTVRIDYPLAIMWIVIFQQTLKYELLFTKIIRAKNATFHGILGVYERPKSVISEKIQIKRYDGLCKWHSRFVNSMDSAFPCFSNVKTYAFHKWMGVHVGGG